MAMRFANEPAPSREDAVRLTRSEKLAMTALAYAVQIMDDLQTEIGPRLEMVEDGKERMRELAEKSDAMLNDLRLTVPLNQRKNLSHTALEYEIRTVPKATPSKTSVVMHKEEFRELVDFARSKCVDCVDNDEECEKCGLFQLLTVVLPLENYHSQYLCPYNMGEWKN
jgi:hypothetical protein